MENATNIAAILGPIYLVMGLSLLIYAGQWKKLVNELEKNHFSVMPLAAMNLIIGLIIINMYNVWEWNLWIIVTLTGWGSFLKGVYYFLAPGSWIKCCLKLGKNSGLIYVSGVMVTVLGATLSYFTYFAELLA